MYLPKMYTQDCFSLNSSQSVTNGPQTFLGIRSLPESSITMQTFRLCPGGLTGTQQVGGWSWEYAHCCNSWPWTRLLFEEQALEPPVYQETVTSDKDRRCVPLYSSVSGFPLQIYRLEPGELNCPLGLSLSLLRVKFPRPIQFFLHPRCMEMSPESKP